MIREYIPLAITLIGAVIGIRGQTWDNTRRGLACVTWAGWLTIILAVSGVSWSIADIRQRQFEFERQSREQQKIRRLAIIEIKAMLRELVWPWWWAEKMQQYNSYDDEYNLELAAPFELQRNLSRTNTPDFVLTNSPWNNKFVGRDLQLHDNAKTWLDLYRTSTADAMKDLDRILTVYSSHIDAATVSKLSLLRKEPYVLTMLRTDEVKRLFERNGPATLQDLLLPAFPSEFFKTITSLETHLDGILFRDKIAAIGRCRNRQTVFRIRTTGFNAQCQPKADLGVA